MTRGRSKRSNENETTAASATATTTTETRAAKAKKPKIEKSSKTNYASTKRLQDDTSDFNKSRLDQSHPHFPEPVDNSNRGKCCALCRYATGGKKYRTNLLGCSRCNVILCVWCFKSFHTLPSISAAKDDICGEIVKRMDEKKKERARVNKDKGKGAVFKAIK